jgi:hypothetical protein
MFSIENERKFRWLTVLTLVGIILLLQLGYDNFGLTVRFLNDYYDRSDYAHIGTNVLTGKIPYVDVVTEYPQIPVYLFRGLTWMASCLLPSSWPVEAGFLMLWLFFISLITLLASWQVWRLLPQGKKMFAWLMFLPAAIYFSLNRFDILTAYLVLLAVSSAKRERFSAAAACLAIGVFTKWYPLLLFPFLLIYEWRHTRKLPWRPILVFGGVSALIVLPTYILGGWQAVWQPSAWHLERSVEPGTFLWVTEYFLSVTGVNWIKSDTLTTIFTGLAFSGILLVFIKPPTTVKKVILSATVSILMFILFTRIFSPQWWLWVLPLLILTIDHKFDLILIILYDLLNYAAFPLAYDLTAVESPVYLVITGLLLLIMLIFIIRTVGKLSSRERRSTI